MGQVTIALQAPVAAKTIERWVDDRVSELRDAMWSSGVRLGRLWPAWQAQDASWLVDVDLRDRPMALEDDPVLCSVVLQMAVLGLRPELLVSSPEESGADADASAAATEMRSDALRRSR